VIAIILVGTSRWHVMCLRMFHLFDNSHTTAHTYLCELPACSLCQRRHLRRHLQQHACRWPHHRPVLQHPPELSTWQRQCVPAVVAHAKRGPGLRASGMKPIGHTWSYLACRTGHWVLFGSQMSAPGSCKWNESNTQCITETNRTHLVLSGLQNRTLGSYLAANNRIPISVMMDKDPNWKTKLHQLKSLHWIRGLHVADYIKYCFRAVLATIGAVRQNLRGSC
jgi:hypothetical protein